MQAWTLATTLLHRAPYVMNRLNHYSPSIYFFFKFERHRGWHYDIVDKASCSVSIPHGWQFESQQLHFQSSYLLKCLGKQQKIVQVLGVPIPLRQTQKKLLVPGFGPALFQSLWPFEGTNQQIEVLSSFHATPHNFQINKLKK